MRPRKRLERIPPYAFAELERKISTKRAEGVDVISLGIGDPDRPTAPLIVEAMQEAVSEPETHKVPMRVRPRGLQGKPTSDFYERRFDVEARPREGDHPSDRREGGDLTRPRVPRPRRLRPRRRPRLPRLHRRPVAGRRGAGADGATARAGLRPQPERDRRETAKRAKLMFLNEPNNPSGRGRAGGVLREGRRVRARARGARRPRQRVFGVVYDGYRAPSFLATPGEGGRDRGVFAVEGLQHDRLALRGRGRQRGGVRDVLAAEDEHRLGPVRGGAAGRRRGALTGCGRGGRLDERAVPPPPRPRLRRAEGGSASTCTRRAARSTCGRRSPTGYASSEAYCEHVLEQAAVVLSPGAIYGPAGEGWFRISLTTPDERLLEAVKRLGTLGGRGKTLWGVRADGTVGLGRRASQRPHNMAPPHASLRESATASQPEQRAAPARVLCRRARQRQ